MGPGRRVRIAGGETGLGKAATEELRTAGAALVENDPDAVAILDDAREGALEPASLDLVVATARLLDSLPAGVRRVVVAGSADGYGEGPGECAACGHVRPENRPAPARAPWDPRCPRCEGALEPAPVREEERLQPPTPLAALRVAREDLVHAWGRMRGVETVSLRFPCLYGPGVTAGAVAAFVAAVRAGRTPVVTEDGLQTRDFLHVADAARAVRLAIESPKAAGRTFNVGGGKGVRVGEVAALAAGAAVAPSGRARPGDARHIVLEARAFQYATGWRPAVTLAAGIEELVGPAAAAVRP